MVLRSATCCCEISITEISACITPTSLRTEGKPHRSRNTGLRRHELDVPNVADAFSVYWPRSDRGSLLLRGRTSSTKTQFGCHNPIANGHRFYVPLELVMVIDGSGEQSKEDSRAKRDKMARPYPSLCGIVSQNGRDIIYEVSGLDMSDPGRTRSKLGAALGSNGCRLLQRMSGALRLTSGCSPTKT